MGTALTSESATIEEGTRIEIDIHPGNSKPGEEKEGDAFKSPALRSYRVHG
jgi:hypothetical protein